LAGRRGSSSRIVRRSCFKEYSKTAGKESFPYYAGCCQGYFLAAVARESRRCEPGALWAGGTLSRPRRQ
jgi:hypothetical protein